MKLMVGGLLVLFSLGVGVVLIGMFLSEEHVARSSLLLHQAPDTVWAAIRDFGSQADWQPNLKRVEPIAGRRFEAWRQIDSRKGSLPLEVIEEEAPRRLVTRIIDDGLPFGGTWTYVVDGQAGGTRVTITEDGRVFNPVFRFVSRFVMGHHSTMDGYLKALAGYFAETAEPEHL